MIALPLTMWQYQEPEQQHVWTYLTQYATGSAVEGLIIYIKVLSLLAPLTNVS